MDLEHRWMEGEETWRPFMTTFLAGSARWPGPPAHRLKIDEDEQTILTTMQDGGFQVRCVLTNTILWGLGSVCISYLICRQF